MILKLVTGPFCPGLLALPLGECQRFRRSGGGCQAPGSTLPRWVL